MRHIFLIIIAVFLFLPFHAIASELDDVIAHYNRGLAYANEKQYDMAIEYYNKAIALNPYYLLAYHSRGLAYLGKKQYDMAIEDYNKIITLDPIIAQAYRDRGFAYYSSGYSSENSGRAIADFQKSCDMGNEGGCKLLQILKK